MNAEPSIFKAYDIRGIYPEQLNEDVAYAIARAYAAILQGENSGKKLTVAVGGDMRVSTPALKDKVIAGLLDSGLNVADIGLVSTPTFYFGTAFYGYDGGIQISASHNPAEWNGLKMVRKNGVPVSRDTGIMKIRDRVLADNFLAEPDAKGKLTQRENVVQDEANEQLQRVDLSKIKKFKIVVDAANAMGSVDMAALAEKIPCDLVRMNFDLDGTFPAHEADPMKDENTADLRARVVSEGADLGVAIDGDADRWFIVDEKGETVPASILRGLMAQIELKEHPGAVVAYDIRPGRITQDMIDELGGKAVVTPVGHSLIKEMMIQENAIFGGESSGHFFYKLPYGTFEAPMILLSKLLQYVSEAGKPMSEVIAPFKRYFNSGEINTKVASREAVEVKVAEIKQKYGDGKQLEIDGITVEYPDYWFNVRASNTEPVIRLTVEGRTPEVMAQKRDELLALIRE